MPGPPARGHHEGVGQDNGRRRPPGPLNDPPAGLSAEARALVEELRSGHAKAGLSLGELASRMFSSKASVSRWLSGRALPSEKQAIAWTRVCGTDATTMLALWRAATAGETPHAAEALQAAAPQPAVPQPKAPQPEAPQPADVSPARPVRWVIGPAIAVVLAGFGFTLTRDPPSDATGPGSDPCRRHPTRVDAPPRADTTFDITVTVLCAPPAGRVYWLFIRGDDIGEHGTTNYYPNARIAPAPGAHVVQNFVKPADADGDRFYLVVSVEQQVSDTLTDKREFVNRLPATGEVVSPSVRTTIAHPTVAAT